MIAAWNGRKFNLFRGDCKHFENFEEFYCWMKTLRLHSESLPLQQDQKKPTSDPTLSTQRRRGQRRPSGIEIDQPSMTNDWRCVWFYVIICLTVTRRQSSIELFLSAFIEHTVYSLFRLVDTTVSDIIFICYYIACDAGTSWVNYKLL